MDDGMAAAAKTLRKNCLGFGRSPFAAAVASLAVFVPIRKRNYLNQQEPVLDSEGLTSVDIQSYIQ